MDERIKKDVMDKLSILKECCEILEIPIDSRIKAINEILEGTGIKFIDIDKISVDAANIEEGDKKDETPTSENDDDFVPFSKMDIALPEKEMLAILMSKGICKVKKKSKLDVSEGYGDYIKAVADDKIMYNIKKKGEFLEKIGLIANNLFDDFDVEG